MTKKTISSLSSLDSIYNFLNDGQQFTAEIHPIFGGRKFSSPDKNFKPFKLDDLVKRVEHAATHNRNPVSLPRILESIETLEKLEPKANRFSRWVTKLRRNRGKKRYDRRAAIKRLNALIAKAPVRINTTPTSPFKSTFSPSKKSSVHEKKIFMEIDSEASLTSKLLEANRLEKSTEGLNQLNLTTDASKNFLQGVIMNCTESKREMAVNWASNHKTYCPEVLEALLNGYLQLDQEEKPVQFSSLFLAVSSIKRVFGQFTATQLQTIDNAIALLIKLDSESNPLQRFIEWMIKQNLVTIDSCRTWKKSFQYLYSRRAHADQGNKTPQLTMVRALPGIIEQLCQEKGWEV